jgi:outer membrane receptor for ferrienterochelin and colicins
MENYIKMKSSNKHLIIISLILFNSVFLFATNDVPPTILSGQIKDTKTGEDIPAITILVKGTTIGTASDLTGKYNIKNVPIGKHIIRVQGIGYKAKEKEITITKGKSYNLNFTISEDLLELEQVVVSANRNEISRRETPVIINSISPKIFETTQSITISESLSFTPGLRMETNCQNCGFTQLRMNGLDGSYTQILINSRPVFSGLAGVYGLEQIPTSMIERVEVIRGGGSALFGSNAIAGTVNIITKEPLNNTYQISSNLAFINNETPDKTFSFNTSLVSEDHKSGIFLFGLTRDKDHWDANGDNFSEVPQIENSSIGFHAYHRPTHLSKISLEFHNLNEERRGGNAFYKIAHEADIAEQVKHKIVGGGLTYDIYTKSEKTKFSIYSSSQYVDRDSYYGAEQDPNAYGRTNDLSASFGFQIASNFDKALFAPSVLTFGSEYNIGALKDEKLAANNIPNTQIANQLSKTGGIYAQNKWDLNKIKLLLGLRYDHYNIKDKLYNTGSTSGDILNPRINLMYDIAHDMQVRLSYAKGFRAPQIFDEDLHIEASAARRIIHKNSLDLTPEKSHSLSSSFDMTKQIGNWEAYILIEGFYTKLIDPFSNKFSDRDSDGTVTYLRTNAAEEAIVKGINFDTKFTPSSKYFMQIGMTMQESNYSKKLQWGEIATSTSDKLLRSPNFYAYFISSLKIKEKLKLSLNGTYTGSMYAPHYGLNIDTEDATNQELDAINNNDVLQYESLEKTKDFFDLACIISYDIMLSNGIKCQIIEGVKNIFNSYQNDFDKGIYRDAGYIYGPTNPLTTFVGIKLGNF